MQYRIISQVILMSNWSVGPTIFWKIKNNDVNVFPGKWCALNESIWSNFFYCKKSSNFLMCRVITSTIFFPNFEFKFFSINQSFIVAKAVNQRFLVLFSMYFLFFDTFCFPLVEKQVFYFWLDWNIGIWTHLLLSSVMWLTRDYHRLMTLVVSLGGLCL